MRIGVTLPEDGPLAAVEPLVAAVRAADELGYDVLWSRDVPGLVVAASATSRPALGLLAADPAPARPVALVGRAAALLGSRLSTVVVDAPHVSPAREAARGARVLCAGQRPPSAAVDGWSPRWAERILGSILAWPGPLVLRVGAAPGFPAVEELLIDLGPVDRLDELLAGWAAVAELRETAPAPPAGGRPSRPPAASGPG